MSLSIKPGSTAMHLPDAWSFHEPFTIQALAVLAAIEGHRVIALAPDRFAEELLFPY